MKVSLFNEEQFRAYLEERFDHPRIVSDCLSRCKRVQKVEGDLYTHFISDNGQYILSILSYSGEDVADGRAPLHHIEISGSKGLQSVYEGTHSLRNAIQHYFQFLKQGKTKLSGDDRI